MIKIYPSVLNGTIKAPGSKACGLRMMFAASLGSKQVKIENLPNCKDVRTAAECLNTIGCKVQLSGESRLTALIEPFSKTASLRRIDFNFRDSATTARCLTVIAAAYGIPANCQAEGTLIKRSQVSMTGRMAVRGVSFSNFSYPLIMDGRLYGGSFELQGNEGSQFISALLTALPVLGDDSKIILTSPVADKSYVQTTLDILNLFKIHIEETDYGYYIPGRQVYDSPDVLECENDWGLAAMWTSAGCVCATKGGKVCVTDLPGASNQIYRSASEVAPLLSQDFDDFNVDASDYPNLATFFAATAIARGKTIRISGVPQLKYKETNRLRVIGQCMENYGVRYTTTDDGITIRGNDNGEYPDNAVIEVQGDPWIFMSLALASTAFKKPIILSDEHCADKIYKDFLKDFQTLGGKFEII